MKTKSLWLNAMFVAALTMAPQIASAENISVAPAMTVTQDRPQASMRLHLAQNSDCDQARNNADTCWDSWNNIGGGSSGQAGAFKQCVQVYCTLLQSHACNPPRRARCP